MLKTFSIGTYISLLSPYIKKEVQHEFLSFNLTDNFLADFENNNTNLTLAQDIFGFLYTSIEYPSLVQNRHNLVNVFLYTVAMSNLFSKANKPYLLDEANTLKDELPQFISYCLANFTQKEKQTVLTILSNNKAKLASCPAVSLIDKFLLEESLNVPVPISNSTFNKI